MSIPFVHNVDRFGAEHLLKNKHPGTFLIRQKSPTVYSTSYVSQSGNIEHGLIERIPQGLKHADAIFSSVEQLILAYQDLIYPLHVNGTIMMDYKRNLIASQTPSLPNLNYNATIPNPNVPIAIPGQGYSTAPQPDFYNNLGNPNHMTGYQAVDSFPNSYGNVGVGNSVSIPSSLQRPGSFIENPNVHSEGTASRLDCQFPSYWELSTTDLGFSEIVKVSHDSTEWGKITKWMEDNIGTHKDEYGTIYGKDPCGFIVKDIQRIHNVALWKKYQFAKETLKVKKSDLSSRETGQYLRKNPILMESLDPSVNEYYLFHGTSWPVINDFISKDGFEERCSSVNGMFGAGIYFAENSSKSNQYIPCPTCGKGSIFKDKNCECSKEFDKAENLEYGIVIARVILGEPHLCMAYTQEKYKGASGNPVRMAPLKEGSTERYDSVLGECEKYGGRLRFREFIVYDRAQAYPEYIVRFTRRPQRTALLEAKKSAEKKRKK
eukprot:TRINITY_DN7035_c0_g1_i1.p1 TRINITY_DN7035_c0_g1~~TRINITY_DN7035_c0_g1_i1.p1  ORF type:complete len:491 (-),score=81.16 TRINITY_DN7035_c0_g1_i1:112-1584(-)